jgi:hypothetical protein
MIRAIAMGKEKAKEGVKVADPADSRVVRSPSRAVPFVPSACSLENS